jgi:hypothetical protein
VRGNEAISRDIPQMQEVKEEPIQDIDVQREVMKVQTNERHLEKLGLTYLQETIRYRESTQHMI